MSSSEPLISVKALLLSLFAAVVCVTSLVCPSRAVAQVEEAQRLVQRASELFANDQFLEAAEEYQRAFELDPHPAILYNLARCYEELGSLPSALRTTRQAQNLAPSGQVRDALDLKEQQILDAIIEQGYQLRRADPIGFVDLARLTVTSLPSGAAVFIGQDAVGATPLDDLYIAPGEYDITVTMDGYRPTYRTVFIELGRDVTVHAGLIREGDVVITRREPGFLEVTGPRTGMSVYLDEDYYGRTPIEDLPVPPGAWLLRVTHDNYEDYSSEIMIESGLTTEIFANAVRKARVPDESFGQGEWGIVALGVGGALLTTGVIFGVLSSAEEDRYHRSVRSPTRDEVRDSATSKALIADIAFISAGVAAATGLILILTDSDDEEEDEEPDGLLQMGVAPIGDGWGLGWSGTF